MISLGKSMLVVAVMVVFLIGVLMGSTLELTRIKNVINNRAVEKGYAEYNSTNGELYYLDKDVKYLIYGVE